MADTVIVGRVAIRVLPDTDGFKERLKRDLEKETANVDATVPVEAEAETQKLEDELRAKVKELSERLKVKLEAKIDGLARQVEAVTKKAEAQSQADPITFESEISQAASKKFAQRVRPLLQHQISKALADAFGKSSPVRRLNTVENVEVRPKVKIDESALKPLNERLAESFRSLTRRIRTLLRDVKVKVGAELDEVSLARTRVGLEVWFQRLKVFTQNVRVVLDKKSVAATTTAIAALSGGRLFQKLVSLEPFQNIDTQLPKIALIATLLGQASNYLVSMVGDALSLGRSIAYILPVAFTLPGLFLAMAASVYAVIAPMSEFNKRIPEMGAGLKAMQAQMTENFWSQASDGLRSLTKLLPGLTRGFSKVGTAAGSFMGALGADVSKSLSPQLGRFFDSLATSFNSITKATGPIGSILADFILLGGVYMPRLAEATAKVTKRFSDWLSVSVQNGDMFAWIERGISSIKALGGVVAGTWRVLDGLSMAAEAAGGSTLQSLAKALDVMQRIVKSADFQRRLVNVFTSARVAIENMVDVAGPAISKLFSSIGDNADKLLPLIGSVAGQLVKALATILDSPVVGSGLVYFFDSIRSTLTKLEPVMGNVSKGIGGLLRVLGTMVRSFEPLLQIAFGALENHADGLFRSVERIIQDLSRGLGGFLRDMLPAIDVLAPAVLRVAEALGKTLGNAMEVLGPPISTLVTGIGYLVTAFSYLPGVIQTVIVAWALLKTQWGASIAGRLAPIVTGAKKVGTAFREMPGPIGNATAAVSRWGDKLKGLRSSLTRFAGIAAGTIVVLGMLSAGMKGPAAGAEELALAMDKLANKDLSGFDRTFQNTKNIFSRGAKDLEDAFTQLSFEKSLGLDGFNKAMDESVGKLFGFRSATSEMRDAIAQIDTELAQMFKTDSSGAVAGFEKIQEVALRSGWSIEELKAVFPEYQSAVEAASRGASGAFAQSAEEVKSKAREIQTAVEESFTRMDQRINALRGKARTQAIAEITKARGDMLKGLAETTTGLDAEMVKQATRLNTKIAGVVDRLNRTKDSKTRGKLKQELDDLLAEYKERFSNLPDLITQAAGGFDASKLIPDVSSGAIAGAAAGMKSKITAAFTGAMVGAQAAVSTQGSKVKTTIANQFSKAAAAGATGGRSVTSSMKGATKGAFGQLDSAMQRYVSGFKSKSTAATRVARTMASGVRGALSGMSLFSAGALVGSSYTSGLRSMIPAAISAARAIGQATKDNKGPESYDKIMLFENGIWVVSGFIKGLRSMIPDVESTMQDITKVVAGTELGTDSLNRAVTSAGQIQALTSLSLGTTQTVYQIGDVTLDTSNVEGIRTVEDLGKNLRRKKRQAGG